MKIIQLLLIGFLLALISGCGNPNLGSVTGVVTFEGAPLVGATVAFIPAESSGIFAVGTTDEQGRYLLASPIKVGVTTGALAGKYRVTISKKEAIIDPDQILYEEKKISYDELQTRQANKRSDTASTRNLIPARYAVAEESGLEADVVAKTKNEFNFDLVK